MTRPLIRPGRVCARSLFRLANPRRLDHHRDSNSSICVTETIAFIDNQSAFAEKELPPTHALPLEGGG